MGQNLRGEAQGIHREGGAMKKGKIKLKTLDLNAVGELAEIQRQLLEQNGELRRVETPNTWGTVEIPEGRTVGEVMGVLRKSKGTAGELRLIDDLTALMGQIARDRFAQLSEDLEQLLTGDSLSKGGEYPEHWFKPPLAVARAAQRGLDLRKKYGRGGLSTQEAGRQGIGSGIQRANDLSAREQIAPETVRRMRNFFNRHQQHRANRTKSGEPAAGMIAWLLWGGDAGRDWAESVVRRMDRQDRLRSETKED